MQERRHRATLNRLNRTERTISPTRCNTLLSQPRNLTIELATGRHVTKRRHRRSRIRRRTRKTVEERRHSVTIHRIIRAERTIRPAGRNTAGAHPLNLLVERVVTRHILKARGARCSELRRTRHTVEERRHRAALHRTVRAERAVRVAGRNTTLSQPVNVVHERVIRRNILEMRTLGRILRSHRHTQNLRTLTRRTIHARQVAGRIVHVQEQGRALRLTATVRHQVRARCIHKQVRNARRIAAKPQRRSGVVERHRLGRIHHSRSGERARSRHRIRNLSRLSLRVKAQNAQRNTHHQSVRIHDVRIRITPGAVQRVQGVRDRIPLAVPTALRNLHQRVIQALLTHRLQTVIGRAVLISIDKHVVGAARGHLLPVTPRRNTEGQLRLRGILTGSLQRRHIRGSTHILQVHAGIRTGTQLRNGDARARSTQLKRTQQGAVTALVHCGALNGQALLQRARAI